MGSSSEGGAEGRGGQVGGGRTAGNEILAEDRHGHAVIGRRHHDEARHLGARGGAGEADRSLGGVRGWKAEGGEVEEGLGGCEGREEEERTQ